MSKYVVDGAELECSAGRTSSDPATPDVSSSSLSVSNGAQVKFEGEDVANVTDDSVGDFSNCDIMRDPSSGNRLSCSANISTPSNWLNSDSVNVNIGDNEALLEGATLQCTRGGTITINDPGQTTVKEG